MSDHILHICTTCQTLHNVSIVMSIRALNIRISQQQCYHIAHPVDSVQVSLARLVSILFSTQESDMFSNQTLLTLMVSIHRTVSKSFHELCTTCFLSDLPYTASPNFLVVRTLKHPSINSINKKQTFLCLNFRNSLRHMSSLISKVRVQPSNSPLSKKKYPIALCPT